MRTRPPSNLAVELPPDDNNGWLGIGLDPVGDDADCGGEVSAAEHQQPDHQTDRAGGRGRHAGHIGGVLSAANVVAPLIGGAIFQGFGSTAPFLMGGLLMAILLLISVLELKPGARR